MSESNLNLFPSLVKTYDMLNCTFGGSINTDELPYACHILGQKLPEEMVIDVLAGFVDSSYMELSLYIKAADWVLDDDAKEEIINRLKNCGFENWLQHQIPSKFIPSYLMGIYTAIRCVFEGQMSNSDYDILLATLSIDMSFRSIARVMSVIADRDYHAVLNDVYGIEDTNILDRQTDDMLAKLQSCGYNPHQL